MRHVPRRSVDGPLSLVMYSGDVQGLGHVRRNTNIAARLVREIPGTRVLVFTGLPSGCIFELPPGVDFIKLPAVRKTRDGRFRPRTLGLGQEQLCRLRAGVIRQATELFCPDLLLVDHMPAGLGGELLPTLREQRQRADPPVTVLGLRDVLDEPRITRQRWSEQGVYRTVNRYYDAVHIYGSGEVFDTRFQYHLDRYLTTPVDYCGYLWPDPRPRQRRPSRQELGLEEGKLVVVMAGGGADGFPMAALSLEAVRRLQRRKRVQAVCVTGPFMSRRLRQKLATLAADLPVRVLWCVDDGARYLDLADLVVTMGGYNTLMEALSLGKSIVTIPRSGPSAEQRIRSRVFADRGWLRTLDVAAASPDRLADWIADGLERPQPRTALPDLDGLGTVVERLAGWIDRRRRGRPSTAPRAAVGLGCA